MAKKVQGYIKLQVPAGSANPSPPIGPALGQQGVNIMEFCKQFNAQTQKTEKGLPIPVVITVYSDRSFTFVMKTPPAAVLIAKAIGIEKGSGPPNPAKVGKISRKQLEEIAKLKQPDLTAADLDAAVRTIAGSARSMGVDVEGGGYGRYQACQGLEGQAGSREVVPGRGSHQAGEAVRDRQVRRECRCGRESWHRREEIRPAGGPLYGD